MSRRNLKGWKVKSLAHHYWWSHKITLDQGLPKARIRLMDILIQRGDIVRIRHSSTDSQSGVLTP